MTRLPAIRTSLGSFGAQTSRYTDTYLYIYQVGGSFPRIGAAIFSTRGIWLAEAILWRD